MRVRAEALARRRGGQRYDISLDVKYAGLETIEVPALVAACRKRWFNQTLTRVNDSVVRIGIVQGEFLWHKHAREDEFFFVLSGRLLIDLESRTIDLRRNQGVTIPKGVLHRPRALRRTVMLMVERSTIRPTGDVRRPRRKAR